MVNINVIGVETKHAGTVFEGSKEDILKYLRSVGYTKTKQVVHDLFVVKNQKIN